MSQPPNTQKSPPLPADKPNRDPACAAAEEALRLLREIRSDLKAGKFALPSRQTTMMDADAALSEKIDALNANIAENPDCAAAAEWTEAVLQYKDARDAIRDGGVREDRAKRLADEAVRQAQEQ